MARLFGEALESLEREGAHIRELSLPLLAQAIPIYYLLATAEASSNLARFDGVRYGVRLESECGLRESYAATRSAGFGAEVRRRILLGTFALSAGYRDAYYERARRARESLRAQMTAALGQVDLLASPTSPTAAFRLGEKLDDPLAMYLSDVFTVPASLAGLPAVSVPCGRTAAGLPVGFQITGPPLGEAPALRLARAVEISAPQEPPPQDMKLLFSTYLATHSAFSPPCARSCGPPSGRGPRRLRPGPPPWELTEGVRATLVDGREVELQAQAFPGDGWIALSRRFLADPEQWKALAEANGGSKGLIVGRWYRIPWELLRPGYRALALRRLFPADGHRDGSWVHRPEGAAAETYGQGLWQVALWFTGDGENFDELARINRLAGPDLPEGAEVLNPGRASAPRLPRRAEPWRRARWSSARTSRAPTRATS